MRMRGACADGAPLDGLATGIVVRMAGVPGESDTKTRSSTMTTSCEAIA
jgi:hypothetical protein